MKTAKTKILYARMMLLLECENFLFMIVNFFRRRRAKIIYKLNELKKEKDGTN
jgi:hypothetical protein